MKTIFAFLTGLLGGTILGVLYSAWASLYSKNFREFIAKEADEIGW